MNTVGEDCSTKTADSFCTEWMIRMIDENDVIGHLAVSESPVHGVYEDNMSPGAQSGYVKFLEDRVLKMHEEKFESELNLSRKLFELEKRIIVLEQDCVKKDLENERLRHLVTKETREEEEEKEETLIDML